MQKKIALVTGLTLIFNLNSGRTALIKGYKPKMHVPNSTRAQRNAIVRAQAHRRTPDEDPCGKCLTECAKTGLVLLAVAATTVIPTAIHFWLQKYC